MSGRASPDAVGVARRAGLGGAAAALAQVGAGPARAQDADVPASGSPNRGRPLCPWPKYAKYTGGDTEQAALFARASLGAPY